MKKEGEGSLLDMWGAVTSGRRLRGVLGRAGIPHWHKMEFQWTVLKPKENMGL